MGADSSARLRAALTRRRLLGLAVIIMAAGCGRAGRVAVTAQPPTTPAVPATAPPDRGTPVVVGPATSAEEAMSRVIPASLSAGVPVQAGPRKPPPVRIVIPSIELDSKVVPVGTRRDAAGNLVWETAAFAVGYHRGTASPGEPGKIVLSGHISSPREGNVFHRLPELQIGAAVILYTVETAYLYRVVSREVVLPTEVRVLEPTGREQVVLITCVPDGIYSHRLIVTADRV